jgi:EpsI family protein
MNSRRTAIGMLAGMVAASGLAAWARPTIKESDFRPGFNLDSLFPKAFADWRIDETIAVIVPPPDQQALLDKIYNQVLARTYINSKGQRVMLSVAYGGDQSDGLTVHVPEVCYASQGFRVQSISDGRMDFGTMTIPVRRLLAVQGGRTEPITYWVIVGDQATITSTERRLVSLRYGLRRRIPEGMLMRVSSIDRDTEGAYRLHASYLHDLMAALSAADRERVVGSVSLPPGAS